MALPAKTSIRVDAIIESAFRNLEAAKRITYPVAVADNTIACLVEGLAQTLLNQGQLEQVQAVLALWKECSSRSEAIVENVRPDVVQARRAL
jgi:hypothetical protein